MPDANERFQQDSLWGDITQLVLSAREAGMTNGVDTAHSWFAKALTGHRNETRRCN